MQDFPAQLRLNDHGNWRSGKYGTSRGRGRVPYIENVLTFGLDQS